MLLFKGYIDTLLCSEKASQNIGIIEDMPFSKNSSLRIFGNRKKIFKLVFIYLYGDELFFRAVNAFSSLLLQNLRHKNYIDIATSKNNMSFFEGPLTYILIQKCQQTAF